MKKQNAFWGVALILLAAYLITSRLEVFPKLPIFKIIVSVFLIYCIVRGIMKINFGEILLPLAFLGCMYDTQLGITAITPWILIISAVLVSIGLEILCKGIKGKTKIHFGIPKVQTIQDSEDGGIVKIENAFNGMSKYINSDNLEQVDIDNSFGQCNVYFDNAIIGGKKAHVDADCAFGELNLYIPKTWRTDVKQDCAFGNVQHHGVGNADMDAPKVTIDADVSFGTINIYYI